MLPQKRKPSPANYQVLIDFPSGTDIERNSRIVFKKFNGKEVKSK